MFKVNGKDDFYPTPREVVEKMIFGEDLEGKVILEPSAGKGDLINVIREQAPKEILGCEINEDLRLILKDKCNLIGTDFLKVRKEDISHVDYIIMNPPFSADEKHILHAWEIAPAGCKIIALCNHNTIYRWRSINDDPSRYTEEQKRLQQLVEDHGKWDDLGECFAQAERTTRVQVALIKMQKNGGGYEQEFEGFFMEEDENIEGGNGIVSYHFLRDLVSRYVSSVKLYDEQLEIGVKMKELTGETFFRYSWDYLRTNDVFSISEEDKTRKRKDFKIALQKGAWEYIFKEMKMEKYSTRGLKYDMNRFLNQQQEIPFTMRNIYKMIEIVIGTTAQRMDKAIVEVFDRLTEASHENRYHVEGWKTNSHYMVNEKFIFPNGACKNHSWREQNCVRLYGSEMETLRDTEKALCYILGIDYNTISGIGNWDEVPAGQWIGTHFFQFKAYKKGTIHCIFRDQDVWHQFNARVAKLKNFPLYEYKKTKTTDKADVETVKNYRPNESVKPTDLVLFS